MLIDPQTLIIIILACLLVGVLLGVYMSHPRSYH
jgi:uncharacterized protein YneF (UPF0154 family)